MVLTTIVTGANLNQLITWGPHIVDAVCFHLHKCCAQERLWGACETETCHLVELRGVGCGLPWSSILVRQLEQCNHEREITFRATSQSSRLFSQLSQLSSGDLVWVGGFKCLQHWLWCSEWWGVLHRSKITRLPSISSPFLQAFRPLGEIPHLDPLGQHLKIFLWWKSNG